MRASLILAFAAVVAAAPQATSTTSSTDCESKCGDYTTWMNSCASLDPSGSSWPSTCSAFCSGDKQKAYKDCTACKAQNGGDATTLNSSLERLCGAVSSLHSATASSTDASGSKAAAKKTDKSGAGRAGVALGAVVLAVGAAVI